MKILVTGSNGLLGQKLIKHCLEHNVNVIATSRGQNRFDLAVDYYEMDITNRDQVTNIVSKVKPDVIVNTAAMTNVDQCEDEKEACKELNVNAVKNLIHASEEGNVFLVHLSTDFIFDGSNGPLDEEAQPNPINYYGESKLESEQLIRESKIDWAIIRTILVFGIVPSMSRSNIILWVKSKLEADEEIQVVNDQFRTPTLAEDLAAGCFLIATKKATGVWNISGRDLLTPYQMALKTAEYFNLDKSLIKRADSSTFTQRAARPLKTGFIIKKAEDKLGYNPHSFDEGIRVLAEQIKANS